MKERIFYYVSLIAGLAMLLYFAPKEYYISRKLVKTGIRTEATVVGMVRKIRSVHNRGKTEYPIFEYTNQDGRINTYTSNSDLIFNRFKVGDVTNIVYDPRTQVMRIASFSGLYTAPIALFLAGCFSIFLGGLIAILSG